MNFFPSRCKAQTCRPRYISVQFFPFDLSPKPKPRLKANRSYAFVQQWSGSITWKQDKCPFRLSYYANVFSHNRIDLLKSKISRPWHRNSFWKCYSRPKRLEAEFLQLSNGHSLIMRYFQSGDRLNMPNFCGFWKQCRNYLTQVMRLFGFQWLPFSYPHLTIIANHFKMTFFKKKIPSKWIIHQTSFPGVALTFCEINLTFKTTDKKVHIHGAHARRLLS